MPRLCIGLGHMTGAQIKRHQCWVWRLVPTVLALSRLRQEDSVFQSSLGYTVRTCLKTRTKGFHSRRNLKSSCSELCRVRSGVRSLDQMAWFRIS